MSVNGGVKASEGDLICQDIAGKVSRCMLEQLLLVAEPSSLVCGRQLPEAMDPAYTGK